MDDYHTNYSDGSGQQFITLVSKSGATFYLVIDRNAKGQQTVHFMNLVDEADLLALMEEDAADAYTAEKEAAAQAEQDKLKAEEEAKKAQEGARAVFSTGSSEHMPTSELSAEDFTDDKIDIVTLLVKAELAKTRNEGRRAVEQGGVSVDGEKITDPKYAVEKAAFGEDGIVLKKGKKNFKKICVK